MYPVQELSISYIDTFDPCEQLAMNLLIQIFIAWEPFSETGIFVCESGIYQTVSIFLNGRHHVQIVAQHRAQT